MKKEEKIIKEVLDAIRPYLNLEGGDIEFIKYEDNYLYVKLYGACSNCSHQDYTLNDNLLLLIKDELPEIEGIINVEI